MNNHETTEDINQTTTVAMPSQVLQDLLRQRASGKLIISDPNDLSVKWRVYIGQGKVHFANSAVGEKERLTFLLKHHYPQAQFKLPNQFEGDYEYICNFFKLGKFSFQQTRKILSQLTQEALIHFLSLPRASLYFEKILGLDPLILALPIKELVLSIRPLLRNWVILKSDISSPFQKPILKDLSSLKDQSWLDIKDYQFLQTNYHLLQGELCLYEIATRTNRDILDLAMLMQPLIKSQIITMSPFNSKIETKKILIACIDDSKSTHRIVKMTLEASGFQVLNILEPSHALTTFVKNRPQLILMDINMPEIDGYELCRMLGQSHLLKDIPVIMLTGRDGFLDKIKAKMVGAVGYISKPFDPQTLIKTVQSHLPQESLK
jgi:twitching motility two-component system response regulator PilG